MSTTDRQYDIVLFGVTGFVGALVAEELASHGPSTLRVGLAGRTASKVEASRERLGAGAAHWGVLTADSSDETAVADLAKSTRVLITTVGPYARYGLPLAKACAAAGTHYVDLTGEVLFARQTIDECSADAERTGARIINSCGYDSVPSDLGVFLLAKAVSDAGDGELTETTEYASMKGGMSGGTVASAMQQADDIARTPGARKVAGDKFSLSPDRSSEPAGEYADSLKVWYSQDVNAWVAPFLMASYNTRVVRRSNALLGHSYGAGFRYREVMKAGPGWQGRARAQAIAGALAVGFGALSFQKLRPLVERIVPKPGTGPSKEARDKGFFRMDIRTTTTTGARYRSVVAADGDPGYKATAVMLAQAALTLAYDELPALPSGSAGGVVTPAVGLGTPYADRLRERGFTLDVKPLSA